MQEAEAKVAAVDDLREAGLVWHLVGHLQANKAKKAVSLFDRIHSVDSVELGERLASLGRERASVRALVQVDLAGEDSKFGIPEAQFFGALETLAPLAGLRIEGLMVLPPYFDDPDEARPFFRRLRATRSRWA